MGLLDQVSAYIDRFNAYKQANTPRNTRPAVSPAQVIDQGLLGGRIGQIPQRAEEMKQGLLRAPQDLANLNSPQMKGAIDNAMAGKGKEANPQQWIDAGMELSGMAPVGGLVGMVARNGKELEQAAKMDAVNMEPGWFRGGSVPDTKRTGPMYTQSLEEAESYAAGHTRRTSRPSDVREYALPKGPFLNADKSYPPKLARDVAAILDDPYYGKEGSYLAGQLRTYGPDERIAGGELWQALEARYGNDGAAEVLDKLGYFKGAKGFTAPGEVYVFKSAPVRDVNAKFDPNRLHVDDIYGHATVPAMLATGLLGAGGLYGLNQLQDSNRQASLERKQ